MQPKIDTPKISTPPPPPTVNQARVDSEQADLAAKRKGRAATFTSDPLARSTGGVATAMLGAGAKQMLGQGG